MIQKAEDVDGRTDALEQVGDIARDIDLDAMEFVPWPGKFLVKRFSPDEVTRGGLELPPSSQETKNWGTVVILPQHDPPPNLKVGDVVVFLDSGLDLEVLGKGYVLLDCSDMSDSDVLGTFRPKKETEKGVDSSQMVTY